MSSYVGICVGLARYGICAAVFYFLYLYIYRILLHPLRKHPGPILAKLSDAYAGYFVLLQRLHLATRENHLKYGVYMSSPLHGNEAHLSSQAPIVRHGPERLVFNSVPALQGESIPKITTHGRFANLEDIYLNDRVGKSFVYDLTRQANGTVNIFNAIDKNVHRRKRRFDDNIRGPHMLTGLEPFGLCDLMSRGFEVDNGTLQDPRALILLSALVAEQEASTASQGGPRRTAHVATTPWLKVLQFSVGAALVSEVDAGSLRAAVLRLLRKRVSKLVLIPLDHVDGHKALAQLGMDSMLAADFGAWFWNTFKVDVPFLDLLSTTMSLEDLSVLVEKKLTDVQEG
ncbi:Uu.00g096880.m01.CDS01 [Anthostomella pinea]|uniref:Uu.00g096880.m01.CDS01 n=1 Tax=Anthostomella pinea TaxID=933095 RepID=A0AAI8VCB4_9PEZI|nr:Uu.00g096880.m01.CDS01 [Anthostomella pinea]